MKEAKSTAPVAAFHHQRRRTARVTAPAEAVRRRANLSIAASEAASTTGAG